MAVLYRGIGLGPETVEAARDAMRQTGQLARNSFLKNSMACPGDVRSRSSELACVPEGIRGAIDSLPQSPLTYACGDFDGAARYALRAGGTPAVIAFDIDLEQVIVDGKDFLYSVFQLWDHLASSHLERVREKLTVLFGETILYWFELACRETDTMARIGLCDLAAHDLRVVERHHANRIVIAGRHDRLFRSAFAVPASIDPAGILEIQIVTEPPAAPHSVIHFDRDMLTP